MQCFFSWRQKRDLPPPWRSLQHADQNLGVVRFALWTMALCLVGVPLSARTLQIWKMALYNPSTLEGAALVPWWWFRCQRERFNCGTCPCAWWWFRCQWERFRNGRGHAQWSTHSWSRNSPFEAFPHHCLKVEQWRVPPWRQVWRNCGSHHERGPKHGIDCAQRVHQHKAGSYILQAADRRIAKRTNVCNSNIQWEGQVQCCMCAENLGKTIKYRWRELKNMEPSSQVVRIAHS